MKILQTIAGFDSYSGGTSTCTYDLLSAMHQIGCNVDLMSVQSDNLMGHGEDWIKVLPNDAITPYGYSKGIAQYLQNHEYDLYHTNGLWMYCNHMTCSVARRKHKPYIITPHGMLYPAALKRSYWKKWPLIQLCFRKDINRADCLHVTCKAEMEHVRQFGYRGAIAVIPNPASRPGYLKEIAVAKSSFMGCSRLRKFGFLGRLHPIKKIENLLYGLVELPHPQECELVIMGKGDDEYEQFLRSETKRLGLENRVQFCGFVNGRDKYEQLAQLSCLFVPSDFENFGMIVTEALSAMEWMSMLPGISSSRHRPTPITPEHIPIMKVSALNTSETLCLDAPMARRIPISLRRSSTLI
jgi:glycosyltransferase involved in cell wall biosynthesis